MYKNKKYYVLFKRYAADSLERKTDFSIFRVRTMNRENGVKLGNRAIEKATDERDKFSVFPMTTCADFVNWTFGNKITSLLFSIPIIHEVIAPLNPPEAINTPDGLQSRTFNNFKICTKVWKPPRPLDFPLPQISVEIPARE